MKLTKAIILSVMLCVFSCPKAEAQVGTTPIQLSQHEGAVNILFFGDPATYDIRYVQGLATTYDSEGRVTAFEEMITFPNAGHSFSVEVGLITYTTQGEVSSYVATINGVELQFSLVGDNLVHDVPNQPPNPVGKPWPPVAAAATAVGTTSFTANWSTAAAAKGYRLDVSTSSVFDTYLSGYQDLDVGGVLSRSVSGLTEDTTYYYRVRAYNDFGTSDNSATVDVTTTSSSQPPAGTNTFFFGPPATPVWDMSGTYLITNHVQGAKIPLLEIVFSELALSVDGRGKLQGTGPVLVQVGDDVVGGDYKVSGNMTGGGTQTRVNFTIKFNGNGTVAGVATACKITAKYNLKVNPANLTLVGKTTGSAQFSNLGNGQLKSDIVLHLPPGVDGSWNVTLDDVILGNKLGGTAVVWVDNNPPTTLDTKLTGKVSQSAASKVKLTGQGFGSGTKLNMEFTRVPGATNQFAAVKGKVLGQNVKN
jgi:hypothetical protein